MVTLLRTWPLWTVTCYRCPTLRLTSGTKAGALILAEDHRRHNGHSAEINDPKPEKS